MLPLISFGQYAPQAGLAGSTALPANSDQFIAWGVNCSVYRGWLNIDSPALGSPTNGDSSCALGYPDNSVVSLGDSGVAILRFPAYIYNGAGADFAVFENGFSEPGNDTNAFLEVAFVAVSSDGNHFFTFPTRSLVSNAMQVRGSGDYMDARLLNNLAGKYKAGYGTPFDLDELAGIPGLDIDKITHIRITDAVGAIQSPHRTHDASGIIINDPFPTNFPTGGFDLDAVGIIHYSWAASVSDINSSPLALYPNPATDYLTIDQEAAPVWVAATITTPSGIAIQTVPLTKKDRVDISKLQQGLYWVILEDIYGHQCTKTILKV